MASVLLVRVLEGRGRGGDRGDPESSASSFYLEIIELDCDWLEEVVAALSCEKPLWLDSRLVIEPLRAETDSDNTSADTHTHFTFLHLNLHVSTTAEQPQSVSDYLKAFYVHMMQNHAAKPNSQEREQFTLCGT